MSTPVQCLWKKTFESVGQTARFRRLTVCISTRNSFQRDEFASSELTDQTIHVEMQKQVEKMILAGDGCCQHPYCLSLDLYSTTLSTLLSQGVVEKLPERGTYRVNQSNLAHLIDELRDLPLRHPAVRYVDAIPQIILSSVEVRAKL